MDWFELTEEYHEMTLINGDAIVALPEIWQRELAALWRLEADVNNGGYLQFLVNWGVPTHEYAHSGLENVKAKKMAKIIGDCYLTIAKIVDVDEMSRKDLEQLLPNKIIGMTGLVVKEEGSILPDKVLKKLETLSRKFMDYPEDLSALGLKYYAQFLGE